MAKESNLKLDFSFDCSYQLYLNKYFDSIEAVVKFIYYNLL